MRGAARAAALSLLVLGLWAGDAAAQLEGSRMEAKGAAVILREDRARAQQRAVHNALRQAVRRVVRETMDEEGLVRHQPEIERSILRFSHQFVHLYRFLQLKVDPSSRRVQVRLEVMVNRADVVEALEELRLEAERKEGKVRVLFLIQEEILGGARAGPAGAAQSRTGEPGAAERRLMYRFARAGYTPVSPRAMREPAGPGQIGAAVKGNIEVVRALAGNCRCPLAVTARAVSERERKGAYVGLVSARAIRVRDGAVIAVRSRQVRLWRRSGGHSAALASASNRVAAGLLDEVRRAIPPPPQSAGKRTAPKKGRRRPARPAGRR